MRPASAPGVLDTNAIIGLAKGDCLALVPRLFSVVYVPRSVVREVKDTLATGALRSALSGWLKQDAPSEASVQRASAVVRGEADAEAVALALDHPGAYLITSDQGLQRKAGRLGVRPLDVTSLIQVMTEAGLLTAARPVLDRMRERGYGIHEPVYQAVLRAVGE